MFVYRGRRAVVTLTDGSAVRGVIAWSWRLGWLKLTGVEDLGGEQAREVPGFVLIPSRSIVIMQVM